MKNAESPRNTECPFKEEIQEIGEINSCVIVYKLKHCYEALLFYALVFTFLLQLTVKDQ